MRHALVGPTAPERSGPGVGEQVEMLRRMDHPNIVKYKDHFMDDQNLYIVMGSPLSLAPHDLLRPAAATADLSLQQT